MNTFKCNDQLLDRAIYYTTQVNYFIVVIAIFGMKSKFRNPHPSHGETVRNGSDDVRLEEKDST